MEESFASGKLVVDGSKRMNIMAVHWVYIYSILPRWPPFKREPIKSFGENWRAGRLVL